jgi:hypothetical protein
MASCSDRSGTAWLVQLNLDVVDSFDGEQGRLGFGGDAIPLALGKARQGKAKYGPIVHQPRLLDPAKLDQAAPAAGILNGVEGGLSLLHRSHRKSNHGL